MYNRQQSNRNWSQQLPVSIIMLLGAIQIRCHNDTDEKPTKVWLTPLFNFIKVPCIQDNNETKIGQNSPLWAWELRRHDDTDEKQTNVWLTPLCQIKITRVPSHELPQFLVSTKVTFLIFYKKLQMDWWNKWWNNKKNRSMARQGRVRWTQ